MADFNQEVTDKCVQLLRSGVSRQNAATMLSTMYDKEYTVADVQRMVNAHTDSMRDQKREGESEYARAVYIMNNRSRLVSLLIVIAIVFALVLAGCIYVGIRWTWIPMIVFVSVFVLYVLFEVVYTARALSGGNLSRPPKKKKK